MSRGPPSEIDIHERLSAFDGWLTGRIEEAHATRKDLAFRDLLPEEAPGETPWAYSLMEPGARSPAGDNWSVYRLNGLWPEESPQSQADMADAAGAPRRSLFDAIADAVFGRGPRKR
jgi:hypothetical protein